MFKGNINKKILFSSVVPKVYLKLKKILKLKKFRTYEIKEFNLRKLMKFKIKNFNPKESNKYSSS